MQRWRPNFAPGDDEIRSMMVWVRLLNLPMEWVEVEVEVYNESVVLV